MSETSILEGVMDVTGVVLVGHRGEFPVPLFTVAIIPLKSANEFWTLRGVNKEPCFAGPGCQEILLDGAEALAGVVRRGRDAFEPEFAEDIVRRFFRVLAFRNPSWITNHEDSVVCIMFPYRGQEKVFTELAKSHIAACQLLKAEDTPVHILLGKDASWSTTKIDPDKYGNMGVMEEMFGEVCATIKTGLVDRLPGQVVPEHAVDVDFDPLVRVAVHKTLVVPLGEELDVLGLGVEATGHLEEVPVFGLL